MTTLPRVAPDRSNRSAMAANVLPSRRRMAVIIVHYRTPELLADCLASLADQIDEVAPDEMVVVENGSGGSWTEAVKSLAEKMPFTLLCLPKNLGFAGGNNAGIRYVMDKGGADYFVLLNADTVVRPGAMATLRQFLEEHPEAACAGPRLEFPDGTAQLSAFGDPSPVSELLRGANIGLLARVLKRWEVYGAIRHEAHKADWVSGACIMLRDDVLHRCGLLDDNYFMYFEEVDLLRRARRAGFATWHVPQAHVVHLVGKSSGLTTDWHRRRLPAYWFESRHRYFRKHYGFCGTLLADAMWLIGHGIMRLRRALTGASHSEVAQHELRDFLRHSLRQVLHPWASRIRSDAGGGGKP